MGRSRWGPEVQPRRLSAADTILLMLDDAATPFCIGAVLRLEGAPLLDAEGRVRLDHVREMAEATIHLRPQNRCVPVDVPGGVGRPVWVEVPDFSIADHVTAGMLPEPTDAALWRAVEELLVAPFPAGRPRWHNRFLAGLPGGDVAVVAKTHHAMLDGVGGLGSLGRLVTLTPEFEPPGPPPPWTPAPVPTGPALVTAALRDQARALVGLGRTAGRALRAPRAAGAEARHAVRTLRAATRSLVGSDDELGLTRAAGPRRRLIASTAALDDLRTVRSAFGVTVNDVLVATAVGGVRRLLAGRDAVAPDATLVVGCPVSTRPADDAGPGNRTTAMPIRVPLGPDDPVERLRAVVAETGAAKQADVARTLQRLADLGDLAPPALLRGSARRLGRAGPHVVVSNLAGPPVPVWLLGARVRSVQPFAPLSASGRIVVVAMSYDGQVSIGCTVDPDVVPDADVFVAGLHAELADLVRAARESPR
jgi:diacylglycerol O-acyltransferase